MVARVQANSRRGRQLTAAKGTADLASLRRGLTAEQLAWNAELEERRRGHQPPTAQQQSGAGGVSSAQATVTHVVATAAVNTWPI